MSLDTEVHGPYSLTSDGQTATVTSTDDPQSDPPRILLEKLDKESGTASAQGKGTLEGAEFTVEYYDGQYSTAEDARASGKELRSWTFATDRNGKIDPQKDKPVKGDELYLDSTGHVTFPIGTYLISESKAPGGYNPTDEVFVRNVTSEGTAEAVSTFNVPKVADQVKRGDLSFAKVREDQSSFAGVPFLIVSRTTGEAHSPFPVPLGTGGRSPLSRCTLPVRLPRSI